MFVLFIAGTEISKIPGLSVAGENHEVVAFTPPADADVVRWGRPKIFDGVPVDPEGHPTPALITRAASIEGGFPVVVAKAGTHMTPLAPYVELGGLYGRNPALEPALPDADEIFDRARLFSSSLAGTDDLFVLGESVPGGTTTALLVLRALGFKGMVSSAGPKNPINLKENLWNQASERASVKLGGLGDSPMRALREFGDPMQAAVSGFVSGLPEGARVVLAGGTQMLAVAAVLRRMGVNRPLIVATTRYVADDPSAKFRDMASAVGVEAWSAPLDFSRSRIPGLADYERGYVKEGVGAGGAVWLAMRRGAAIEDIVARTETLYEELVGAR